MYVGPIPGCRGDARDIGASVGALKSVKGLWALPVRRAVLPHHLEGPGLVLVHDIRVDVSVARCIRARRHKGAQGRIGGDGEAREVAFGGVGQ